MTGAQPGPGRNVQPSPDEAAHPSPRPAAEPRPVLEVQDVAVSLGGRRVLDGVDLALEAGEVLGLVGPNGAGKTTLLRTALGLIAPERGRVRIEGAEPRRARRRVGYVPQKHDVDWNVPMTVRELVLTGRIPRWGVFGRTQPEDVRAAASALDRVGLGALRGRPIAELSGGQRQRALIARALCLEPALLLLDEPYTGVDVPTQELVTELLHSLAGEGTGIVMTTHDLHHAAEHSTRLCVVKGAVLVDDSPRAAIGHPALAEVFGERTAERLALTLGRGDHAGL